MKKIPALISARELSVIINKHSERTLQRYAKSGKYPVEIQQGARSRGGKEYRFLISGLPKEWQIAIAKKNLQTPTPASIAALPESKQTERAVACPPVSTKQELFDVAAIAREWNLKTDRQKLKGQRRAKALFAVERLQADGLKKSDAVKAVASAEAVTEVSIWGWFKQVRGCPRDAWHMILTDNYSGCQKSVEIDESAWEYVLADYLRPEAPTLAAVYDRALKNFELPSIKTVQRRINELPITVRVLAREGVEALGRMYPHQERDPSWYGALEAVNADGHKFDVFVAWPDGEISRPVMAAWQDVYSRKILSYEVTKTENTDTISNAFGKLAQEFGIPDHAYLDNGRGFASKWLTGGTATRYRFKVKDDEPLGILTLMGVKIHWCTPYHGQAKPIERAFKDFCAERISKHPALAGAYTGNNPMAKPENYGSRAVPLALFMSVLDEQVKQHNARDGRRTKVCDGRSFDETFAESYEARKADIRHPSEETISAMLMKADTAKIYKNGSHIFYNKNRYYNEALIPHRGEKVTIRFDSDRMHSGLMVYAMDGRFICRAGCVAATGFGDTESAREHARAKNQFKRATKEQLKAVKKMSALECTIPNITVEDEGAAVLRIDGQRVISPKGKEPEPAEILSEVDDDFDAMIARGVQLMRDKDHTFTREKTPAELLFN
ncbi:MAG: transposase domain-containing protein [Kiritimatiellales bacterium]